MKKINGDRDYIISLHRQIEDLKMLVVGLIVLVIGLSVALYMATNLIIKVI